MPRVQTSWKDGMLTSDEPRSTLRTALRWLPRAPWVSAMRGPSAPSHPASGGMLLTPQLRLVRPVNDGRGTHLWVADHLALAAPVEVTFAEVTGRDAVEVRTELEERALAFRFQAEVAAVLDDPHVVQVLEHGESNGAPFVVTKLLEGKGLRQRLLHGPVALAEVQAVVRQVTGTLGKAHSLGITHGRLRPDHLFSTEAAGEPFIEVAGFGATAQTSTPSPYASPEQLLAATGSDARSDLWALAVTIYELLTTTLPFEAATPAGVTVAICNTQFAPPTQYRTDLPPGIDDWFSAAFAKDPASRFRDAAEFAHCFALAIHTAPRSALASVPLLPDDSLELDDDDDDEEKTVKWDMPEDARAIARGPLRPGLQPGAYTDAPYVDSPYVDSPYVDSPYVASVAPALAVTNAPPGQGRSPRSQPLLALARAFFTPEKTGLAALAFAAGVAVTWFAYEPEPEGEAVAASQPGDDVEILTLSVDDLPRIDGSEGRARHAPLPAILQPSQLPRAGDDDNDDDGLVEARVVSHPGAARRAAPPPRKARSPRPAARKPRAAASKATGSAASASRRKPARKGTDCTPPYYFDKQGIRRLKSDCLNGSGVIVGPYGAVMKTNVAAKAPSPARGKAKKQARAGTRCSPPYYLDGKIRRLKPECL